MPRPRLLAVLAGLGLAALFVVGRAGARVEADCGYTKVQAYSAALRYLRVDLGYEIVEKDPDAAYLIFRYVLPNQPNNPSSGTVEIVATDSKVKLFVQIPRMPEYHERVLRDGLLRKLRDEYGIPVERPAKKPEPSDAGAKD